MDNSPCNSLIQQDGYDYEFVPPLDSKYECAVCLLCLKDPVQTVCGHRFCEGCIINLLRCPLDNNSLSGNDLFRDQCFDREIKQLKVRCPNSNLGCACIVELIDAVICPNECSSTLLQKELDEHLSNHCILRVIKCELCGQPLKCAEQQAHMMSCPRNSIPCETCSKLIPREEIIKHSSEECLGAVICCTFVEHGCREKMIRADLDRHMIDAIQKHIMKKINAVVSDLSKNVGMTSSPTGNFSRQQSLRNQFSTLAVSACNETPQEFRDVWDFPAKGADTKSELSTIDGTTKKALKEACVNGMSLEDVVRESSNKILALEQRLLEEKIRLDNTQKEFTQEVHCNLDHLTADIFGRFCYGKFVWKVKNYHEVCNYLQTNGQSIHSPPFYTSPYGYKFCLRHTVTNRKEDFYVSLHIHLMAGENDDLLEWPFSGVIKLSILDCGETIPKHHISEEMNSRPDIKAFNRSKLPRNTKGFGFVEFIPISEVLKRSGDYLKDDTLFIRIEITDSNKQ